MRTYTYGKHTHRFVVHHKEPGVHDPTTGQRSFATFLSATHGGATPVPKGAAINVTAGDVVLVANEDRVNTKDVSWLVGRLVS